MNERLIGEIIEGSTITLSTACRNQHRKGDCFDNGCTCDYDILYILHGAYAYQINQEEHRVQAGEAFLLPSGCRFSGRALEDSAHYYCHFTMSHSPLSTGGKCLEPAVNQILLQAFQAEENSFLLKSVIRLTLYHVAREIGFQHCLDAVPPGIRRAVAYINSHPRQSLSGGELAALADMNYSYFSRCFRKSMGVSLQEYRSNVRMEEAKRLLLQGMRIADIAAAIGFSDPFSFSRAFKKHFGTSPSQWKHISF